ncbi:hypothetical protein CKJ89_38250, partial [Klebsiella pneumoniae]
DLIQGYDPSQLEPRPDLVIIGNAMTRGNPCVEACWKIIFPICPAAVAARLRAARSLGAGRRRDPRQNHHCRHGDLD